MADSDDELQEDEIDYYGVLNVRKQATEEELRSGYRRMCVIYHPDKHQDPAKKAAAAKLFNKVQQAYDVLSNPETRAIYDIYGQKGLDAGWQVVERKRSPAEIQAEYEQLQREREERRLQQRTNPKGSISVDVDATCLFDNFDVFEDSILPNIEISRMSIMQSIEAPLTTKDTAILSGSLSIKNGNGSGDVSMSLRRVLSHKAWGEVEFGAGNGPTLVLRGFRNLTKRSYGNADITLRLTGDNLICGWGTRITRQLSNNTVGFLTWHGGMYSFMDTTVVRETERSRAMVMLKLGISDMLAAVSYTYKFEDSKIKTFFRIGKTGTLLEYGAQTKISQYSYLGAYVNVGLPTGVHLKIKLNRSSQVYSFKVSLSEEISPSAIFYGTVVPVVVYWAVKVLVVNPFLKHEKEKEAKLNKEKNEKEMCERRKEANTAIELMQTAYERIVEFERSRHGLIIISAWYGKLVSMDATDDMSPTAHKSVLDVTVPIQCQVKDSRLLLSDVHKYNLSGFFDPCPGEDKLLRIRYEFRDVLHEITVGDEEAVKLPKQSHKIAMS